MELRRLAAGLAVAWLALGCAGYDGTGTACTEEFRQVLVTVTDSLGAAAADVAVTHTLPSTGRVLHVVQSPALAREGRYVVLSDAQRDDISHSGEAIRVTGVRDAASFVADFVFDVPAGCHVRKLAGPDSVALR